MLMNINVQNGYTPFFQNAFHFAFFKRNSIQSKIRVYLRHVCENCSHDILKNYFLFFFSLIELAFCLPKSQKRTTHNVLLIFFALVATCSKEFGLSFSTFSNFKNPKRRGSIFLGTFLVSLLICKKKMQVSSQFN